MKVITSDSFSGLNFMGESHELYFRMPNVVILSRTSPGELRVYESEYSNQLFRELNRIAKHGDTLCGLMSSSGVLDKSSIRAINVYLRVNGGINWPPRLRAISVAHGVHRWAWKSFIELVGLRFAPWPA
jgi:hypothetical protein